MEPAPYNKLTDIYGKSTMRVILLACLMIVASILTIGVASYKIVQHAALEKLKQQDLIHILGSMSASIDGRIQRAVETSLLIADSPAVVKWFGSKENNKVVQEMAIKQLVDTAKTAKYSSIFMANAATGHFWTSNSLLTDTLVRSDPDDSWFFDAMASRRKITPNIDHNRELNVTMLWINTLMGDVDNPVGVAGVGVDLSGISDEFRNAKVGKRSDLWLVDRNGTVSLAADAIDSGVGLSQFLPIEVVNKVLQAAAVNDTTPHVLEYNDKARKRVDLVFQKLKSADWILVFQISRSETVAILHTILYNTLITIVIVIILIVLVFYLGSIRIANPYKRAMQLNAELEKEVESRTLEIQQKTAEIIDSITYAKRIQESILPSSAILTQVFAEHFVIWQPRDIVGGDFYWIKEVENGWVLVVGDCTGHGVPGALMTMAVNSLLNNIIGSGQTSPACLIRELDLRLKAALNKDGHSGASDDGLDAAVCYIQRNGMLTYAGARLHLYICKSGQLEVVKGQRQGVGYLRTDFSTNLHDTVLAVSGDDRFYITTDGFVDQNGGEKDHSLGRRRFMELITSTANAPMAEQQNVFATKLAEHSGTKAQRDDITVLGFRIREFAE